jgi:hypothetical protein
MKVEITQHVCQIAEIRRGTESVAGSNSGAPTRKLRRSAKTRPSIEASHSASSDVRARFAEPNRK